MKFINHNLEHFKYEPYQNYMNYFCDLLDEKGSEIVDEMLMHLSISTQNGRGTTLDHIKERHFDMGEKAMVELALNTGQKQAIFAYKYDEVMDYEDFKDMVYSSLWEGAERIAQQVVDSDGPLQKAFSFDLKECIGYGIDENFSLVKTSMIEIVIKQSDDPFSESGICIGTAYPSMKGNTEVIKNLDALKKEYGITDKQIEKFRRKQIYRNSVNGMKKGHLEEKAKSMEKRNLYSREKER